ALTDATAPAIGRICRRLDGIPLAIELAAARVRTLGLDLIAQRLDEMFRVLTAGHRAAPQRHQTLRATIEWSYQLLTAQEKLLFARLSTFAGGWTVEAAEQVCADVPTPVAGAVHIDQRDVLELLASLVDRS